METLVWCARPWARCRPLVLLAVVLGLVACHDGAPDGLDASPPASAFEATVATAWMDLAYTLVKTTPGYSPPEASRLYAYAGVTLYEAVVPGAPDHRSLAGQLTAFPAEALPTPEDLVHHWPTVANHALATVLAAFFPGATAPIAALTEWFDAAFPPTLAPDVLARSAAYGQAMAQAILAWAATDGFADLPACTAAFVPPPVAGAWEGSGPGVQPCWGTLRPFVGAPEEACPPLGPPAYSTAPDSAFYTHALLVYTTTGDAGAHLTPAQRAIATFWADPPLVTGTPAGHWVAMTGRVAAQEGLSLLETAEAYARVGLAVADAFITGWHTKFTTYLLRPVTYIQAVIDASWEPLLPTPNFPTYPSGHAIQSGAAATVLTALLGVRAFTDTTHRDLNPELGLPARPFQDVAAAAAEAAVSRLYGGIHYRFDSADGLEQGRCLGTYHTATLVFTP